MHAGCFLLMCSLHAAQGTHQLSICTWEQSKVEHKEYLTRKLISYNTSSVTRGAMKGFNIYTWFTKQDTESISFAHYFALLVSTLLPELLSLSTVTESHAQSQAHLVPYQLQLLGQWKLVRLVWQRCSTAACKWMIFCSATLWSTVTVMPAPEMECARKKFELVRSQLHGYSHS